jgi:hypothetical protein
VNTPECKPGKATGDLWCVTHGQNAYFCGKATTPDPRPLSAAGKRLVAMLGPVRLGSGGEEMHITSIVVAIEREAADAERARHAALVAAARAVVKDSYAPYGYDADMARWYALERALADLDDEP